MSLLPVQVEGLSKAFWDRSRGRIAAVDEVTFSCSGGEIFGLLGANGAGKTTTLRMLSTVLAPSSGTAKLMGHDVSQEPQEVRRNLGFYSVSTALYPRLTARETLRLFAVVNGLSETRAESRCAELIARFDLADYADVRIEQLSTGMKQKVSIARTIAHDPPVLIFDEPTMGLDVLNSIELQKVIAELRDEGKTVVFSTHIMSEAERLCDRIAIIHLGQIHACDTLEGLRESTGLHYLEDIFVQIVQGIESDSAKAQP